MARGRKSQPTALKVLAGVRPCRVNASEPQYDAGCSEPPSYLAGKAIELWHELAPTLSRAGVLTAADRHALATLCESFRLWREEPENLKRLAEWRRLMGEFGLTPVSRTRVKAAPAEAGSKLDKFRIKKA